MSGVAITEDQVQEALRGARFPARRRPDMPLLFLEVVTERLRDSGEAFSPALRWDALTSILRELVKSHLVLSTPTPSRAHKRLGSPSAALAHGTDALKPEESLSTEDQAWFAVYHWAFASPPLTYFAIGSRLKIGKSTAEGRGELARRLIAECLGPLEEEARRRLAAAHVTTPATLFVAEEVASYKTVHVFPALTMLWDATTHRQPLPALTPGEREAIAGYQPRTIDEFLLCRIAAWQDRDPFDQSFVDLSLWLDEDGVPGITPPYEVGRSFTSLETALADLSTPLVVVVGDPGSGKTTLLAHLEQEVATAGVRGTGATVPMLVRLAELPVPWVQSPDILRTWLHELWATRNQNLPGLAELVAAGRLLLLLDGLNELPHADRAAYAAYVALWRDCAHELLAEHPGNRIVFSCRTLDYTIPLSSSAMPVPRLKIKPLSEEAIRSYLARHLPVDELWGQLEASGLLDVLRVPYHLRLFAEIVVSRGAFPTGQAGLFATFVRHRLRREVARPNLLFFNDHVLVKRDCDRLMQSATWATEWHLPENGPLIPSLDRLARQMHEAGRAGQVDGLIAPMGRALAALGTEDSGHTDKAYDLLTAGIAIGVLDNRPADDTVAFTHQQMQAYFAGRTLATAPQPELAGRPWRRDAIAPTIEQLLRTLHPAEPLPPLDQTGWEEASILAAEMADDPTAYVAGLMDYNIALAGRCAAVPAIRQRLTADLVSTLQEALRARSRNPVADLRDRIDCGRALGLIGDHRFSVHTGTHGTYALPPLVEIEAGIYPIGDNDTIQTPEFARTDHQPRHQVPVARFAIATFPVTNAEFAHFIAGGGYESECWWDTNVARQWRQGVGVAQARRDGARDVRDHYRQWSGVVDRVSEVGIADAEAIDLIGRVLAMSEEEFDAYLVTVFPDRIERAPEFWNNEAFNGRNHPVVGITWYEARAYCNWLSAQSGQRFRLPTEVEWEAAARGLEGRLYAYGNTFDPLACNVIETHLRLPTPAGVFPEGDTPEGVCDLSGNVWEWTSTAWGTEAMTPQYPYPYDATDEREESDTSAKVRRIVRGGSALTNAPTARTALRGITLPGLRVAPNGMRVVCDLD